MRKIFFTTILSACALIVFGQDPALKVDANGNIGFGTSSPSVDMELVKTNGQFRISEGVVNQYFEFRNSSNILSQINKKNDSGNAILDINPQPQNGSAAKFRYFRSTNTTGDVAFEVHYGDNSSGVNCKISGNGNSFFNKDFGMVGIGTNAPTHLLSVDGSASKPGGGTWSTFSDKRLKHGIEDFELGLETVLQIEPVRFKYNGKAGIRDTETEYVGVIAQDVQKVLPNAVREVEYQEVITLGEDENQVTQRGAVEEYLTFDGTSLTYILINAIKDQQEIINSQKRSTRRFEK